MQTDWPFDWKYNYHAQVYNKMRTMVYAPDQIPVVLRPGQLWTVSIEPLVEMSHHLLVSLIEHLVWTGSRSSACCPTYRVDKHCRPSKISTVAEDTLPQGAARDQSNC